MSLAALEAMRDQAAAAGMPLGGGLNMAGMANNQRGNDRGGNPRPTRQATPVSRPMFFGGDPMFNPMQQSFIAGFGPMAQANSMQSMYGQLNNVMGAEMSNRRRMAASMRDRAHEAYLAQLEEQAETERLLMRIQHEREMARQQAMAADKASGVLASSRW